MDELIDGEAVYRTAPATQLEKVKEEANKVKTESEALKHQIKELNQTIQNQKNRLENINSEESKIHQLVYDIKNFKSKHKDEQVQFEAILAKSKKEIYESDEQRGCLHPDN